MDQLRQRRILPDLIGDGQDLGRCDADTMELAVAAVSEFDCSIDVRQTLNGITRAREDFSGQAIRRSLRSSAAQYFSRDDLGHPRAPKH
jgi:hypothetical protein